MIAQASAHHIPLPDASVHCIVTSPPYFGLRRYAGRQEIVWPDGAYSPCTGAPACIAVSEWRGGFGSEPTVEMYIWHSLLVLRECWRVLRPDGVVWFNIGDSYASNTQFNHHSSGLGDAKRYSEGDHRGDWPGHRSLIGGLAQGNLIGIPHRLLLAAQVNGWIVRNDCVWAKVAPMPESVRGWRFETEPCECVKGKQEAALAAEMERLGADRATAGANTRHDLTTRQPDPACPHCGGSGRMGEPQLTRGSWRHTRAHEFILMLVKDMNYWSDGEIIRETWSGVTGGRQRSILSRDFRYAGREYKTRISSNGGQTGLELSERSVDGFRNPRSVLIPRPSSYKGAHFAVFPADLIRPLILSSAPRRCCPVCGQGWAATVEASDEYAKVLQSMKGKTHQTPALEPLMGKTQGWGKDKARVTSDYQIRGYRPTCTCPSPNGHTESVPGIVLDPFCGSGTAGLVCRELGLRFVGLDISLEYLRDQALPRAERRTSRHAIAELPLFREHI